MQMIGMTATMTMLNMLKVTTVTTSELSCYKDDNDEYDDDTTITTTIITGIIIHSIINTITILTITTTITMTTTITSSTLASKDHMVRFVLHMCVHCIPHRSIRGSTDSSVRDRAA